MNIIDTEEYKGYKIDIYADYDGATMRWEDLEHDGHTDYFTTYGRWGNNTLFDVEAPQYGGKNAWLQHINAEYNVLSQYIEDYDTQPQGGIKDAEAAAAHVDSWIDKNLYVLPIYVYEHGGITMNTQGYSCDWDSGMAGFIYTDKKRVRAWLGKKHIGKNVEKEVYKHMKKAIDYRAALLEGDVIGYTWEYGGCGGFIGDDKEYMLKEAYADIDMHISMLIRKHNFKVKGYIKNRVPLEKREALELGNV